MELYAIQRNFLETYLEAIENATLSEKTVALDRFGNDPLPSIITRIEGSNEATISITGVMTPAGPSPLARFFGFGGTGYIDIIAAAKSLENDPSIENVKLAMDTPGGTVAAMDQARQAIEILASKKNVTVENHGMIASAGYYLATAKGIKTIVAMSPLVETGSIGVVRAGFDFSDALSRNGIKRIKIISSNAPNKQADPATAQGLKVHQDDVDAMERVFIDKVATGRNTTVKNVIENFGKGGMFIAQDPDPDKPDAIKAGMIDSIITQNETTVVNDDVDSDQLSANIQSNTDIIDDNGIVSGNSNISESQTAEGGGQQEGTIMDLTKLKAEHPALYAQAVAIGVDSGVKKERERVDAHITMGEASGDMKLAMSCITEGTEHSASINAKYMASQMKKNAIIDRGDESEGDLDTEGSDDDDAAEKALSKAVADELGVDIDA